MNAVLNSALPIFALILTGFICGYFGVFDRIATDNLNRFAVYLALPSLMFVAMSKITPDQVRQFGFVAAFFPARRGIRRGGRRSLPDRAGMPSHRGVRAAVIGGAFAGESDSGGSGSLRRHECPRISRRACTSRKCSRSTPRSRWA